jgi:hypothetical protein
MQLIVTANEGVVALELRRQLDVSYPTACVLRHTLTESMHVAKVSRQLEGRIKVDDAFLGGERSTGLGGRGSENEVPSVVTVQSLGGDPHRLCPVAVPHRRAVLDSFCKPHICRQKTIFTDCLAASAPQTMPECMTR